MPRSVADQKRLGAIMRRLHHEGMRSDEVLKEAWRQLRAETGVPEMTVQQRRYAQRKSFENPREKIDWQARGMNDWLKKHPNATKKEVNEAAQVFFKPSKKQRKKNPTAVLEDRKGRRYTFPAKRGQYRTPLELERAASRYHGQDLGYVSSNSRKKKRKNPIAIYNPKVVKRFPAMHVEIKYKRTNGLYRGENFRHSFKADVAIEALSDGSLRLKSTSGKRLWGTVD